MQITCGTCNGDGFVSYGDRHVENRKEVCPECRGETVVPMRTGETPGASASPDGVGTYADHQLTTMLNDHYTIRARDKFAVTSGPLTCETFATIAQWCEETFGPITPERMVERAGEEFEELRAEPSSAEEAADVVICLARVPGLWEAVERKMVKNRLRRWALRGDGTGYHIKE
jgi:hypothetical protein